MEWTFDKIISTEKELREILGHPQEIVTKKAINHIDDNCRLFIESSPFFFRCRSGETGVFLFTNLIMIL